MLVSLCAGVVLGTTALLGPAAISGPPPESVRSGSTDDPALNHVGTFFLQLNLAAGEEQEATSAEILAFSPDRHTLVYTDAFTARLGFVDTSTPADPQAAGFLDLPGDPTSVAVAGGYALVAVVTSEDPDGDGPLNELDAPSGALLVIDLASRAVVRTIDLAGQPDSVAVAPSGRYAAIVIENERDEDENDGLIPQPPGGLLHVLQLQGGVPAWELDDVDLSGLATIAPGDPEPEYVDINRRDQAVVTLQENNHLVLVDLPTRSVIRDFSAGNVNVDEVDTTEEEIGPQGSGAITLDGSLTDRRREPDTVQWVDANTFATANEGDYEDENGVEGGSRSFTLFNTRGFVEHESRARFEHSVVQAGHYPEARSENKGSEPEGLGVGRYHGRTYLFVASERGNAVAVYQMRHGRPVYQQILPTGIGPEGLQLKHGLLAVSSEVDGLDEGFAARPFITFFKFQDTAHTAYPMLASARLGGLPIPWVAQSGLSGDPRRPHALWSVSDSYLGQAYAYRIDTTTHPARIVKRIPIGEINVADQTTGDYDLEGVAARRGGGFWFASEGRVDAGSSRPNLLVRTNPHGEVLEAVELPSELAAVATSSGFEGLAVTGTRAEGTEVVYVALQREWADDAPGHVKIGRYDVAAGQWTFAAYPLDPVESPAGGWVGLSELTRLPDGRLAVLERDNQLGLEARIKRLYAIDPDTVDFMPYGETLPVLHKSLMRNLLPLLDEASISVPDKVEGLGLTRAGRMYTVTDNDGVDENYGETVFIRVPR